MLRLTLANAWKHRSIRPLYAFGGEATPVHCYLDPAWDRSVDIYPGMAMMRTGGDNVAPLNATGVPFGLAGLYVGGDGIDEPLTDGVNSFAVWVMSPMAEFEIDAPAFDDSLGTWVDPTDGTELLVSAYESGADRARLCPIGTSGDNAQPLGRLVKVISDQTIVVGGLRASGTYS